MKQYLFKLLFILIIFSFAFTTLFQEFTQAQKVRINPTLKQKTKKNSDNLIINVELINVLFTVKDRRGGLVTDLQKPNFKLYEDNKLQKITNFSQEK